MIVMKKTSVKQEILDYLYNNKYHNEVIKLTDLYSKFKNLNEVTIRQTLIRLTKEEQLIKVKDGIYTYPNTSSIIGKDNYKISTIIEQKYLFDSEGNRIGYIGGINFANKLGLTTQTAKSEMVYSNIVANKKRRINIKKHTITINAPRVLVTNNNYKLLQVLDLLNDFKSYSELSIRSALTKISNYLLDTRMSIEEMDEIVSKYPLLAQKNFYQMGVDHVITQNTSNL